MEECHVRFSIKLFRNELIPDSFRVITDPPHTHTHIHTHTHTHTHSHTHTQFLFQILSFSADLSPIAHIASLVCHLILLCTVLYCTVLYHSVFNCLVLSHLAISSPLEVDTTLRQFHRAPYDSVFSYIISSYSICW